MLKFYPFLLLSITFNFPVRIQPWTSQHVSAVQLFWQAQQQDGQLPGHHRQGDPGQAPQPGPSQGKHAAQPWVQRQPGKVEGEPEEEEGLEDAGGGGNQRGAPDHQEETHFKTRFGGAKIQEGSAEGGEDWQEDCGQEDWWQDSPEERIPDEGLQDRQHSHEDFGFCWKTTFGSSQEVGVAERTSMKDFSR